MTAAGHVLQRALPNERPLDLPDELLAQTLRAACEGDPAAFAQLVRAYYPRCLRFARYFLASREDAEECVQDAFMRVYQALHRYEERERFDAWLFRILANRCRTARNRARWRLLQRVAFDRVTSTSTGLADGFVVRDEMLRALAELPSDQREAFLLRHVDGFTYEQIAAITAVAVTAARMRVSRACLRLRMVLGDVGARRRP